MVVVMGMAGVVTIDVVAEVVTIPYKSMKIPTLGRQEYEKVLL